MTLPEHEGVRFRVHLGGDRSVTLPAQPVTVPSGAHFVWPIGLDLGAGLRLDWATAQPATRLDVEGTTLTVLVAVAGIPPTLALPAGVQVEGPARVENGPEGTLVEVSDPGTGALLTLTGASGSAQVLVLSHEEAPQLTKVTSSDANASPSAATWCWWTVLRLHIASADPSIALLPAPAALLGPGVVRSGPDGAFTRWSLVPPPQLPQPTLESLNDQAVTAPARTLCSGSAASTGSARPAGRG